MNREIKFKALDKTDNKIKQVINIDFCKGTVILYYFDYDSNKQFVECTFVRKIKDCILLEYTGLNDKNDTPIYEGDILKSLGEIDSKVIFSNGSFCGEEINGWDVMTKYYPLAGNIDNSYVIGNIYENPELLSEV